MTYNISTLIEDVKALVGEIADELTPMIVRLLPEIGTSIIMNAPMARLGDGIPAATDTTSRLMPCGLHAIEIGLPNNFLRLISVKIPEWDHPANRLILPDDASWECQWSSEPGIAGCPARPRAYLDSDNEGRILRLIGSTNPDATPSYLQILTIPHAPDFHFPTHLYPELLRAIVASLCKHFPDIR